MQGLATAGAKKSITCPDLWLRAWHPEELSSFQDRVPGLCHAATKKRGRAPEKGGSEEPSPCSDLPPPTQGKANIPWQTLQSKQGHQCPARLSLGPWAAPPKGTMAIFFWPEGPPSWLDNLLARCLQPRDLIWLASSRNLGSEHPQGLVKLKSGCARGVWPSLSTPKPKEKSCGWQSRESPQRSCPRKGFSMPTSTQKNPERNNSTKEPEGSLFFALRLLHRGLWDVPKAWSWFWVTVHPSASRVRCCGTTSGLESL